MTKRAAGIAAATVLMMCTAAAAAGGVLPTPFGATDDPTEAAWRHDGAAVTSAEPRADATAVSVASEPPAPLVMAVPSADVTILERAHLACAGRDDDAGTQAVLDLGAAAAAAGLTEDELCGMVLSRLGGDDDGADHHSGTADERRADDAEGDVG